MITMSNVPKTQIETLLNLETVKENSKEDEKEKEPELAPFFYPPSRRATTFVAPSSIPRESLW